MAIADITFLLVIGIGILAFTAMAFVWKGIIWLAWISAIFWLLLGIWCRATPDVTFMFQREIGILFLGIFLAMLFAPFYMKAKDAEVLDDAPDDIDIWKGMAEKHRERVDRHKGLKKSNRREEE